jgi:hypothetical protein
MHSRAKRMFAGAVLLFTTACASGNTAETTTPTGGAGAGGAAGGGLTINILNEHESAGTFVLFIEQVGGVRQSLGTVQAGRSPRITFAANTGSAYTLVQQTETGDTRVSDRFTFQPPTTVTWDMNTRRLSVLRR